MLLPGDRVLSLAVQAEDPEEIDALAPFFDYPVAAIRSPTIRVAANNLIRISVLVRRPMNSLLGKGGVIIHDSIGGDPFQFRTCDALPGYNRVVLYRKAPADGTFNVTLGLAGFGEVFFDDFRVQVMEQTARIREVDPGLAQRRRPAGDSPRLPDPRVPADTATRVSETRRPR